MVRPEDIGRIKQSHQPRDLRSTDASGAVAFIELGTGNSGGSGGGSVGRRCCSMGFWHETQDVDHHLHQQLLQQQQQQQQQRHRRLQSSAALVSLPPHSVGLVDQEKAVDVDHHPSVSAVRSLTQRLDQQRLRDDDDDIGRGVRAVTVTRMPDDPPTGRESDEVDSGTATDDDDVIALGGADLADNPAAQNPYCTEAKKQISFSSEDTSLSGDYCRAPGGWRFPLGTFSPQPRVCTAFRYRECGDCCNRYPSVSISPLVASSSTSPSNEDSADASISTSSSVVETPFDRLEHLTCPMMCSHNRSSVTGCSSSNLGNKSLGSDAAIDNLVRRGPTPVMALRSFNQSTEPTTAVAVVGSDSTHGRSAISMPASPSSFSSLPFQLIGSSSNEIKGQRRRDLGRSSSLDDETSRWPFVPEYVDDALEGDSGSVSVRFRSIVDISRKRRTGERVAHSTSANVLEPSRRNSIVDNMSESSEDVCDEEVSDLLSTNDAFPLSVSCTSGPRCDRPPIDISEKSSSSFGTTSVTLNGIVNESVTDLWLQKQKRQSPCKRRRSSDECDDPLALTLSSTHRPSLDLYKMQRLSRWRRRHRTISSPAVHLVTSLGRQQSSPKPIQVVFQPIVSSSDPPSAISPFVTSPTRDRSQFPTIRFTVV